MVLTKVTRAASLLALAVTTLGIAGAAAGFGRQDASGSPEGVAARPTEPGGTSPVGDDRPPPRPPDAKAATARALKQLKGKWTAVKMVRDGQEESETGDQFVFDGKEITVERANGRLEKATFEIDPSSKPMKFDVAGVDSTGKKLKPLLGIIKIEKNKVTICNPSPGARRAARPKEFTSTKENQCQLVVLERAKP
jgi:uncharacterized protein (TIGR03067 family)